MTVFSYKFHANSAWNGTWWANTRNRDGKCAVGWLITKHNYVNCAKKKKTFAISITLWIQFDEMQSMPRCCAILHRTEKHLFLLWFFFCVLYIDSLFFPANHFIMIVLHSHSTGYIETTDMTFNFGPKVRDEDWVDLIKHYWLILLVVFIAALIIVLMPIIG